MISKNRNAKKAHITICMSDKRPNNMMFNSINHFILPAMALVIVIYFTLFLFGNEIKLRVPNLDVTIDGLVCAFAILILASACGQVFDHSDAKVKYILITLSAVCVTLLQTYMTYIMVLTAVAPLLIATQYSSRKSLLFAYILSMISSVIIVFAGYNYGLCDANMVIAPLARITDYSELSGVVKPVSEVWKDLFILFVLPRFILISSLTILLKSVIYKHNEMLENDVITMKTKSEHDALTGLYNREHFDKVLNTKYLTSPSVLLMFFDINNLKYINDTKGHDAGDNLIIKASKSIKAMSDITVDVYRFGGDEFLAVVTNCEENEIKHYLAKWEMALADLNSIGDGIQCDIASGYAFGMGKDFHKVFRQADANMYNNKLKSKYSRQVAAN